MISVSTDATSTVTTWRPNTTPGYRAKGNENGISCMSGEGGGGVRVTNLKIGGRRILPAILNFSFLPDYSSGCFLVFKKKMFCLCPFFFLPFFFVCVCVCVCVEGGLPPSFFYVNASRKVYDFMLVVDNSTVRVGTRPN